MKFLKAIAPAIFALPLAITVLPIQAASLSNTKITTLMLDKNHGKAVFIETTTLPTTPISCHHSKRWSYVLPLESDLDKHFYSMLLTAHAAGKTVNLDGVNGTCAVHDGIETLRRIEIQ